MNKSTNLNNSSIASTQFSWDSFWNSQRVNHDILKEWSKYFFRSYENQIGFKVDDVILDYGAGCGDLSILMSPMVKRYYVYDKSQYMKSILLNLGEKMII